MGGVVETAGKDLSSSLQEIKTQKTARTAYRAQAAEQEYQAVLTAAEAERQQGYLLQSAAEKMRALYQAYRRETGNRQVQWAASGLRGDSATVQHLLRNNRFAVLVEEQTLSNRLRQDVYENTLQAADKIRSLKELATANRRAAQHSPSRWKLGTSFFSLLGGR